MAAAVTLSFNSEELTKFLKRTEKLPTSLGNSLFDFSKVIARNLRKNATTDPLRPITQERMSAAQLIRAKKLSKFRSVVSMPQSLVFLDSMKPHYVSLKRGRKITAWAKRNAGTTTVSGRSSVKRGSRGGITGYLYVVPHPFVQRTLHNARKMFPNELRKGIVKTYKGTAA